MVRNALLALVLTLFSSAAFAHACPALMAEIDEFLEGNDVETHVEVEDQEKARALREDGERYHNEGDHDSSMEALEEAKALLGL